MKETLRKATESFRSHGLVRSRITHCLCEGLRFKSGWDRQFGEMTSDDEHPQRAFELASEGAVTQSIPVNVRHFSNTFWKGERSQVTQLIANQSRL